jgi:hypothetical protein
VARKLVEFLLELASDPDLTDAYKANPETVLAESGLSSNQRRVLLRSDLQGIHRELRAEGSSIGPNILIVTLSTDA